MKLIFSIIPILIPLLLLGQNLVPNPEFELYDSCPTGLSDFEATSWNVPTSGTSDYFNECANNSTNVSVPMNVMGYQESQTGAGYSGIITFSESGTREFIQAELDEPTIAGLCYELEILYSPGDFRGHADGLGMFLSDGIPSSYIGQIPQLEKQNVDEDDDLWHTISANYTATANQTHVTIGNFQTNQNTTWTYASVVYYIDFVSVKMVREYSESVNIDLGEDLEVCIDDFPITITSNIPEAYNVWSSGEIGDFILVDSPGTYYVNTYENCVYGSDTIHISIKDEPIITAEESFLCIDSDLLIEMDESLGEYTWEDGSTGPTFNVTESGTYNVTLTYECGDVFDQFTIENLDTMSIPNFFELEICELELPYVVDYSEFDDGINEFLWTDGSDSPEFIISASGGNGEGSYSLEIFNDCYIYQVDFDVDISFDYPLVYNFVDTIVCPDELIFINPGLTNVEYQWHDGSQESYFIAPGAGNYAVTISNFCRSEEFEFVINTAENSVLDLGSDLQLCPGDSVYLSAPPKETIIWSTGEESNGIWVSSEGTIIGVFEGHCSSVSDTLEVTFDGVAPQIDIPDSLHICSGDSIDVTASTNPSGLDFFWNSGELGSEITISAGGTYIVTGTNNCGIRTDSVHVTVSQILPDISLEPIYSICSSDTISLQVNASASFVTWSTGIQDSVVELFEEGIYYVTLNNLCQTSIDSFEIQFLPEIPNFNLGDDLNLCEGDSLEIYAPSIDASYLWNTGNETNFISLSEAGEYWLEIEGICNSVTDSILVINLGPEPFIELGPDLYFCQGDTLSLAIDDQYEEVIWNTGSMGHTIDVTMAGTYIVSVSNICGSSIDSIIVEINNEIPQIELGLDQVICQGDSFIINAGNLPGEINWNTGASGNEIMVHESGEYIANLISSCGESSDTIQLDFIAEPAPLNFEESIILCAGESYEVDLNLDNNITIHWSNGSAENQQIFYNAGTYWADVYNMCGIESDSFTIEIIPEISNFNLPENELICDDLEYTIETGITQSNVDIAWNTGDSSPNLDVNSSGLYWLNVSNQCFNFTDSIIVSFMTSPVPFDLGNDDTICFGESILLDGFQGEDVLYAWQNNDNTADFTVTETGFYSLEISTFCGIETDEIHILVLDSTAIENPLESSYIYCEGVPLLVDLSSIIESRIEWFDQSTDPIREFFYPGEYQVQFSNICIDTIFSFLFEQENCSDGNIFLANSFTPNGDGINDFFNINLSDNWIVEKFYISIYSRWGEQIYESTDIDFQWSGKKRGKYLNPGVFAYYFEIDILVDGDKKTIQKSGDITIIK